MPTLEEMRAEINRLLPDFETPQFVKNIQTAYQNMPGAAIPQAALSLGSSMVGAPLGAAYGVGKTLLSGKYGTQEGIKFGKEEAKKVMDAFRYTPPTKAGREIAETVERLPQTLTGSEMGIGMLPEIWNMPPRISPSDVQVMGARGINAAREVADIPRDFSAAQSGMVRMGASDKPTYGARLQAVAEDVGDVLARRQAMRSDEGGTSLPKIDPLGDLITDMNMYAVKPKGGNWPTNLGSTLPLKEQGQLGEYLSNVQYNDPVAVFENQLKKYFPRAIDNRQLLHDWEDFLKNYYLNNANGIKYSDLDGPAMQQLRKEAANEFAKAYNAGTIGSEDLPEINKKLYSASQIEQTLPYYNSWVMGPFQKYITNQMGTGLATDPLLQAIDESNLPLKEIFGFNPNPYLESSAESRRKDFIDRIYGYGNTPEKQAALENSVIGKITATSPQGIEYENALDATLYPKGPHSFKRNDGDTSSFPALNKINRDALIADFLSEPYDETGFQKIRSKLFMDLLSGKLDPNKLSNVTPATITRQIIKDKMEEFKKEQLSKQAAADWIPKRAAAMPTDLEFPDGSKMTIITPEMANSDENMTARDLGQITIDLNQCVGAGCRNTDDYSGHGPYVVPHTGKPPRGKVEYDKYSYLKRLKNGEIEIASLKDPNGVSQFTIRLDLRKKQLTERDKEGIIYDWLLENNPDKTDDFSTAINTYGQDRAINAMLIAFPELRDVLKNSPQRITKSIGEMKGKNNVSIQKEYVPHMVSWLNQHANDLNSVYDLENLPGVNDLIYTSSSIAGMMDRNQHWNADTVEQFFGKIDDERLLPRFFTDDEFALKATELGVDLSAKSEPKVVVNQDQPKNELSPAIRAQLVNGMAHYFDNPNDRDFQVPPGEALQLIRILAGDQDRANAQLPPDMHERIVNWLLTPTQYAENIRNTTNALERNPADFGLTESQGENLLNIITNWMERFPLTQINDPHGFHAVIAAGRGRQR